MRTFLVAVLAGAALAPAASAARVIGPGADGTTLRLAPNSVLVVRLPGNITTGFSWAVRQLPAGVRLTATSYVAPRPARIGQGGTFVLRFAVAAPRGGLLQLGYARRWEKQRPAQTFTVRLRLR